MTVEYKELAEKYLRGVYGGDPAVVDNLAAEEIVSSYPVFEKLFETPVIRGREAVKRFATGFGSRWTETRIAIHEAIAEGEKVVLLWSFQGRNSGSADPERPADGKFHSWGGITLIRFDASGKITAEIGEESTPGPARRETGFSHETPPR